MVNINYIVFDTVYGNEDIDEIDIVESSELDHYYKLVKSIEEAKSFNYHSDYWGFADDYQEQNVELMEQLSKYIGREVVIDFIDETIKGKLLGIAIDKQYNDIHHTKVVLDSIEEYNPV